MFFLVWTLVAVATAALVVSYHPEHVAEVCQQARHLAVAGLDLLFPPTLPQAQAVDREPGWALREYRQRRGY